MRPPRKCSEKLSKWTTRHVALPMAQTSQVEDRLRAILRSPKRGEVARRAALIAGVLMAVFLGGLAALRVTVRLPATVDASTPLAQNGFILLAVQRGDGSDYRLDANDPQNESAHDANVQGELDGTGLWIQPPSLPNTGSDALRQEFRVHVRASSGTQFTLPYGLAENGYPTNGHPALLCVGLPPGYPDSDRYFDVSIADRHGHRARWRVTHLPPMRHVLAPPVALQSRFSSQGFTVKADAWHEGVDPHTGYSGNISTQLRPVAFPPTLTHHWDMTQYNIMREWQPESLSTSKTASSFSSTQLLDPHSRTDWISLGTSSPYGQDLHLIGLDAKLCQFETYDEPVTFHNVVLVSEHGNGYPMYCVLPAAQSVTTPSGITVTLPRQAASNGTGRCEIAGATNCTYIASAGSQATFLPHSPLCLKYHLPVSVQITVAKPYQFRGNAVSSVNGGPAVTSLGFDLPRPYPKRIANLTLIVRQRVDLQTLPMHFVVPVEDAPPPVFRPNVSLKKANHAPGG